MVLILDNHHAVGTSTFAGVRGIETCADRWLSAGTTAAVPVLFLAATGTRFSAKSRGDS